MQFATFGVGSRVKKLRGRSEGVITRTYPPSDEVLVRWYDTKDDERVSIHGLRLAGLKGAKP